MVELNRQYGEPDISDAAPFHDSQHIDPHGQAFFRVTALAALILGIYAIYNMMERNYELASIEIVLSAISTSVTWLGLSGRISLNTVSLLLSLFALLFFTYLNVSGAAFGSGILWTMVYPFIIFFLNGINIGLLWIVLFFLLNTLLFAILFAQGLAIPYSYELLARSAVAYCSVAAFSYYYEKQHVKYRLHLNQSREKFERLIRYSSDIIAVVGPAGEFLFVSPSVERVLGYRQEELIGTNAFDYIHGDDSAKTRTKLAQIVLDPGRIEREQFRFRKQDGSWCMLDSKGRTYIDDDQSITAIINARDITQQQQLEDQLAQSRKMEAVGTLVGGIAHDFNNTLAAMKGILYLARKDTQEKRPVADRLDKLDTLSTHAAEVVSHLLTFARKDMVRFERFSLTDFMREEFSLPENVIPQRISFAQEICSGEIIITGDRGQCRQALLSLLSNARDAVAGMPDPQIALKLDRFAADKPFLDAHDSLHGNRFAHITVSDNGRGIAQEHLKHIFDPFFTTKEVGEGPGLGLSMVYGAVSRHGGIIEVESTPGEGTTFHIYLPMMQETTEITDTGRRRAAGKSRNTVLLVDDDPTLLAVIGEALRGLGFTVLPAGDGAQALELFYRHRDEIVITVSDVVMPNMGGVDLLARIRETKADFPVILMTGYNKIESLDIEENIDNRLLLLRKPFTLETLTDSIGLLMHKGGTTP